MSLNKLREIVKDTGASCAAVHGVAKSQTWLRDFTLTFHCPALEKEMATRSSVLAWRIPWTEEHLKQIYRDTVHPFKVYTWVVFHKFIRVLYPLPQSVLEQFHHPRKKTPYPLVIISLAPQLTTSLRQPLFQLDCHIDVPVLVISYSVILYVGFLVTGFFDLA